MRISTTLFGLIFSTFMACATSGTQAHDMSVGGHEDARQHEEQIARGHEKGQSEWNNPCPGSPGIPAGRGDVPCWGSFAASSAEHENEARRHRELAAQHRSAAHELLDAETTSCSGLTADDRDMSPFVHRADIASVDPILASQKGAEPKRVGASIVFRRVAGLSAGGLQRIVNCHLARNAAMGHNVPEMPYCPLVPKGVTANVTDTPKGLAVAVRSNDAESAEVWRRAEALAPR